MVIAYPRSHPDSPPKGTEDTRLAVPDEVNARWSHPDSPPKGTEDVIHHCCSFIAVSRPTRTHRRKALKTFRVREDPLAAEHPSHPDSPPKGTEDCPRIVENGELPNVPPGLTAERH